MVPDSKKISIVMNCYNGEDFLSQALNSVLQQTYNNWELIFWDNCSNDGSKKILNTYNDIRIKYFKSETHTSQYEARKRAVQKCNGEFIAFLDVDDWWEKDKLSTQLALFDDPKVGFSCCNYLIINERKNLRNKSAFEKLPGGYITEDLLEKNFVGMSTLMIRKTAYDSLEYGFNPEYEIIGDYDLVLRLSLKFKLASSSRILSNYRCHDKNLSFLKFDLNISELEKWSSNAKEFVNFKNFKYLSNFILFYRGMINILNKNRLLAFQQLKKITNFNFRLKLIIIIFMPLWLIKKLRS